MERLLERAVDFTCTVCTSLNRLRQQQNIILYAIRVILIVAEIVTLLNILL